MKDTGTKKRTKRLLIGAVAGVLGVPFFAILHNAFDALSSKASDLVILSRFLGGLDVACFLLALIVCPAVAVICLVWAVIDRLAARGTTVARRILLIVVPTVAAVFFFGKSLSLSTKKAD